MKHILFSCLLIISCIACHSQILKKVLNDAKNQAEWKVRSKTIQKTDQAIDSLLSPSQKSDKKSSEKNTPSGTGATDQTASSKSSSGESSDEMTMGEGFVQFSLSADEVFKGGTVVVNGTSVKYGELKQVTMEVKGGGDTETEKLSLFGNGSFSTAWQSEKSGLFTITIISSDGKERKSKQVKVVEMELIDWCNENIDETERALDKLKKEGARVKQSIGSSDRQELDKEIKEVEEKAAAAIKLFNSLNVAIRELAKQTKRGLVMPPELVDNLSQLNDKLSAHEQEMERINKAADHEPYDNTICEYLVMLNEACAAFSTFTNVWSKSVATILKNVVLDKAVPKAVETANNKAGGNPGDLGAADKAAGKIFATAKADAEGLFGKISAASFAGDITQFATDVLMKKYCGVFKGELSHTYTIIYRNSAGRIWWQYSYTTNSAVTFRYPKSSNGSIIKMKGNIEGNATSFRFTEDIEWEDEFNAKMKSRAKLIHVPLYQPPSVPFSSAQNDGLGFGAIARGVATPAYFNIPVDADFNTDDNTIQLFLNEPLIDFTSMVKYTYGYVAFVAGGIPLVTRVDFPINKAKLTLNAVVSQNNQLTVTKDAKNNLFVKGGGDRHIGSETGPIEHKIIYSLTAKNDN